MVNEVFVLKLASPSGSKLSDLEDFMAQYLNFPHPKVTQNEDGCVIISDLFDGIPDDEENQYHEAFDNLLKLVGWIEGRFELPICSDPAAHQMRDKSPRSDLLSDDDQLTEEKLEVDSSLKNNEELIQIEAQVESFFMKEPSDVDAHHVSDEMLEPQQNLKQAEMKSLEVSGLSKAKEDFTSFMEENLVDDQPRNELLVPLMGVSFDPGGEPIVLLAGNSNVIADDDLLTNERLLVDDALATGEEPAQMETTVELTVENETSKSDACHVFDELLKWKISPEIKSGMLVMSRASSIVVVMNPPHPLAPKFGSAKVNFKLQKWMLENTWVVVDSYDEMQTIDPGGTWLSFLDNEDAGSNGEQDRLKVIELMDVKGAIPSLLVNNEFSDLFMLLNELAAQGKMMKGYEEVFGFDPGGIYFTYAPHANCLSCRSVFQLVSLGPEMFDELCSHTFGAFTAVGCQYMMISTVGDVFGGQIHNILGINNSVKALKVVVKTEFAGLLELLRMMAFDYGEVLHKSGIVVLFINNSELRDSFVRMMAKHDNLRVFNVESSSLILVNVMVHNPLPMLNYNEKLKLEPIKCSYFDFQKLVFDPGITFKEKWKCETEFDIIDECLRKKLKLKAYMLMGISVANNMIPHSGGMVEPFIVMRLHSNVLSKFLPLIYGEKSIASVGEKIINLLDDLFKDCEKEEEEKQKSKSKTTRAHKHISDVDEDRIEKNLSGAVDDLQIKIQWLSNYSQLKTTLESFALLFHFLDNPSSDKEIGGDYNNQGPPSNASLNRITGMILIFDPGGRCLKAHQKLFQAQDARKLMIVRSLMTMSIMELFLVFGHVSFKDIPGALFFHPCGQGCLWWGVLLQCNLCVPVLSVLCLSRFELVWV